MARKLTLSISAVTLLAVLGGCVSQEQYNALKLQRDRLQEQLQTSDSAAFAAKSEADALRDQLSRVGMNDTQGKAYMQNLQLQLNEANSELAALRKQYEDALRNRGTGVALSPELNRSLQQFAAANSDFVSYDPQLGLVKFRSDVTFAPGDAQLTSRAAGAVQKFANILSSSSARGYELLVAGHTDNTPVTRRTTIAKGHKDNWYLSSHRAISVAKTLMRNRVSPQRIGVVGYADQRPAKSNATAAGKAANRRVEVMILPSKIMGAAPTATITPSRTNTGFNKGGLNKGGNDTGMNKDFGNTANINEGLNK